MPEDLQLIRKRKGMEAAQLAARAGIPLSLLKEYEAGSKPISPDHLRRLARALYVEPWDINPRSAPPRRQEKPIPPRHEEKPLPHRREEKPAAPPSPKKEKPRREQRPPAPIREGQIAHLLSAAARFGIDRAALEAQIGKPLEQMNEVEGRQWNRRFVERLKAEKPPKKPIDRRRAYLPEGVDRFESNYLEAVKASGDTIAFTLFNGEQHHGAVIGYCPYSITIRQADGSEMTLNKLAIAYYRRAGGST